MYPSKCQRLLYFLSVSSRGTQNDRGLQGKYWVTRLRHYNQAGLLRHCFNDQPGKGDEFKMFAACRPTTVGRRSCLPDNLRALMDQVLPSFCWALPGLYIAIILVERLQSFSQIHFLRQAHHTVYRGEHLPAERERHHAQGAEPKLLHSAHTCFVYFALHLTMVM